MPEDIFENIGPDFDELVAHKYERYRKRHPLKSWWHRIVLRRRVP